MITIKIPIKKVISVLSIIVAILTVIGAIAMSMRLFFNRNILGLIHLFGIDQENNVTTWYSSVGLLFSSLLIFVVARIEDSGGGKWSKHWYGLSGIFLFMSVDETATIHEHAGAALQRVIPAIDAMGGAFTYSWVVLGIIAVIVVTVLYIRFFISLPRPTQILFFLAAASFVGGALGVEMLNSWTHSAYGSETIAYVVMTVIEEMLEMVGVIVFVYALLDYIKKSTSEIRLSFVR